MKSTVGCYSKKGQGFERKMIVRKEKSMDFFGIGAITVLTLIGMYFALFTESSFTGAGFVFGIVYFFLYKASGSLEHG